ncbi:MAG: AzlD domain-containing protein [Proteobacteria bacterium]|jgi:branched-subunit amino acid transport protein|nr:AzlD domain-containing protein [Pseudomonadota bacterium]
MDPTAALWVVIVIVGALNYASRLSFIAFFARRRIPAPLARAFRYVPAAMLTALIVPMIAAAPHAAADAVPSAHALAAIAPRVAGAAAAIAVAWRTHGTLPTLVAGMGVMWIVQAIIGAVA